MQTRRYLLIPSRIHGVFWVLITIIIAEREKAKIQNAVQMAGKQLLVEAVSHCGLDLLEEGQNKRK